MGLVVVLVALLALLGAVFLAFWVTTPADREE